MRNSKWFPLSLALLGAACGPGAPGDFGDEGSEALSTSVLEGESFSGGGSVVFNDTAASASKGLAYWSQGTASRTATTAALSQVTLRLRGDQCQGAPAFTFSIDGKAVLTGTVPATAWTSYSANVNTAAGSHTLALSFNNDLYQKGTCDRNLRFDKVTLTAAATPSPAGEWEPTDLRATTWQRPTGSAYVTWESLAGSAAANAQAAAPNTPVLLTATFLKSITGNRVLTLPKGIFEFENGFSHSNNSVVIGVGGATGLRGIAGSGSHSTPGANGAETILRMHGKVPAASSTTVYGNLIKVVNVNNPYFAGFSLVGTQTRGDNIFNGGLMLDGCTGTPIIERFYERGVSPGYANFPPGETFGINIYKTPNAVIRDSEIDGRDVNGTRTMASPIGWNNVVNDTSTVNVQRVYTHHGVTSMLTFWETTNLITEDYYTYSWSSGTGQLNGAGINHEQSGGRIRHIRPRLFINGPGSNGPVRGKYGHPASDNTAKTASTGPTFSVQSGLTDATADFQMIDPEWDNTLGKSGILCMASYDGYSLGQKVKSTPRIEIPNSSGAEVTLQRLNHPQSGWNTGNPLVDFAWIH